MATRVTGTKTVTRTGPSVISAPTTSISLDAPTVYITGGINITDVTTITNKLVLSTVTNTSLLSNKTVYFNSDQTANVIHLAH